MELITVWNEYICYLTVPFLSLMDFRLYNQNRNCNRSTAQLALRADNGQRPLPAFNGVHSKKSAQKGLQAASKSYTAAKARAGIPHCPTER